MRRLLIATMLLLLGVAPAHAATGGSVRYMVDGAAYEGYYVSPAKDAPLVVIVHDWDGLTDYEVKRAQMLADLGYAVFAVDLFGAGVRPEQTEDKKRLTGALYQDRAAMRARLYGGLDAARALGADTSRAVAAGYCFGGTAVLEWARSGADLDGFVTFHGGLSTPEGQDYSQVMGPVLVLHGSADKAVSLRDFAQLGQALESAGKDHEMITYAGAPHAFTVFGSSRYHQAADTKSWARFQAFLGEVLGP